MLRHLAESLSWVNAVQFATELVQSSTIREASQGAEIKKVGHLIPDKYLIVLSSRIFFQNIGCIELVDPCSIVFSI